MKNPGKYKNKDLHTAAFLGILLGFLGIHHFYLGNYIRGILYLLFFWTTITFYLALIDVFIICFKYIDD